MAIFHVLITFFRNAFEEGVMMSFAAGDTTPDENALELEEAPPNVYTFSFSLS
jgi:hypothetical protein